MFNQKFFEEVVKKYGDTSGDEGNGVETFFYLYFKTQKFKGNGYVEDIESYEESSFKIIPKEGVLEIIDLNEIEEHEGGCLTYSQFVKYEKIEEFLVSQFKFEEEA